MELAMTAPTFPAEKVAPLRSSLGLTQEEFAKKIGVARTLVTHWENGIRVPSGPAAILLSQLEKPEKSQKQLRAS